MDTGTIGTIISNIAVGGVFVWAWAAERKERQELLREFSTRLDALSQQYLSLLREILAIKDKATE